MASACRDLAWGGADGLEVGAGLWRCFRDFGFDDLPAGGEVVVAFREGSEAVQMVGQDDPGVDVEGTAGAGFADGGAKGVDVLG